MQIQWIYINFPNKSRGCPFLENALKWLNLKYRPSYIFPITPNSQKRAKSGQSSVHQSETSIWSWTIWTNLSESGPLYLWLSSGAPSDTTNQCNYNLPSPGSPINLSWHHQGSDHLSQGAGYQGREADLIIMVGNIFICWKTFRYSIVIFPCSNYYGHVSMFHIQTPHFP